MASKIKILFTIPNFDTAGSGIALMKVAQRLDPQRFDIHIGVLHTRGFYFKNVVAKSGYTIHEYPFTSNFKSYPELIRKVFKVSKYLRKNKFDIIHSYHYGSDYSEALAAKIAGIPWIYTKKNMNWGGSNKNGWKLRTLLAKKIAYQNTDMKKMFFPKLKKTILNPCGVDTSEFYPRELNAEFKKNLGIPEKNKIVITVANLVPVKGIEYLIKGFDKVYETNNSLSLLIVGDTKPDYAKKMIELASSLKSSKNIIFTGKKHNVRDFLNISDIFVLSSISKGEGSPVASMEAMASGLIFIGSEIPGVRDQLSRFPELMFKPMDSEDLAQKLNYVLSLNQEQLKYLKKKLLKNIQDNYLIEREANTYQELYYSLKPL